MAWAAEGEDLSIGGIVSLCEAPRKGGAEWGSKAPQAPQGLGR